MSDEMTKTNTGKKVTMNASVSPATKREVDKYGTSAEYGSRSTFIEDCVYFMLGAKEKEKEVIIQQLEAELHKIKAERDTIITEYEDKLKIAEAESKNDKETIIKLLNERNGHSNDTKDKKIIEELDKFYIRLLDGLKNQ